MYMYELPFLRIFAPLLFIAMFLRWPLTVISIVAGLFLFFRNPQGKPHHVAKFFHGFRFGGHRGSPHNAPENTLASFKQAEDEGVDLIEFDIGLTKDMVPVIMHDQTLDRTTNMWGSLSERTINELASCNCAANFKKPPPLDNEPSEPAPILRLEELVKWAKGRGLKMIFDVKDTDTELAKQLEQLFLTYDLFDSAMVCSFYPSVIYRIKRHNKHILTGVTWRRWFNTCLYRTKTSPLWHWLAYLIDMVWMWSVKLWLPEFLGADLVLTERGEISENYVKYMHARGLKVCAWTVNNEREMAWMTQKLKIPFLTDFPHKAQPIVEQWSPKPALLVN